MSHAIYLSKLGLTFNKLIGHHLRRDLCQGEGDVRRPNEGIFGLHR